MSVELPAPYLYDKGYIYLPVSVDSSRLPDKVEIGEKNLTKKESFHVSLVCVKEMTGYASEDAILELFAEYVKDHPIEFVGFINGFHHATKGEDETVVVRCSVSQLEEFFERLNEPLHTNIPVQPTHVTLYTLVPGKGIGITSEAAMQAYPKIELPEIFAALS